MHACIAADVYPLVSEPPAAITKYKPPAAQATPVPNSQGLLNQQFFQNINASFVYSLLFVL